MNKKNFSSFGFIRENRQLIFGISLIIIIPSLVVFNSFIFFKKFTQTLNIELHDRAITIGKITSTLISKSIDNPDELQDSLVEITERSPELLFLEIDRKKGADLVTWVSTKEENIGKRETGVDALFAWQRNQPIAFRTQNKNGSENFWSVNYPLKDNIGEEALLKMHLSTENIEVEARDALWQSFLLLIGVIIVIMFLLLLNSRLFQYAVLYRKLRELDESKDNFISIASHELRTPISAIRGYFQMLADGSYGEITKKTKESVLFMSKNVERLQRLVEELLNVSRIQQGRIKIENKDIDAKKIIESVLRSLMPNAKEKHLELKSNIEKTIIVYADKERLKQVLINIIGNAIKYTERGSIITTLIIQNNIALIKVKDTGIGMSSEEQKRIFEKFYRIQNNKTKNITGTGLGLWITRAIIELMGGKIFIDSIENTGTQVTITIPLAKKSKIKK